MNKRIRPGLLSAALLAVFISAAAPAFARTFDIEARQNDVELYPGFKTAAWTFGGSAPGTPIVVSVGERVTVRIVNRLPVATNLHWHGLEVPNDQDGPAISIEPGQEFTYSFTVNESGTYWYHSHRWPVLGQMDRGLYGAFIVTDPIDAAYSSDRTFVLDDWLLGADGSRYPDGRSGMMERYGNVETVNGKIGAAIAPLVLKKGELHKLRFINASTAASHRLRVSGHRFRVTHTDGHPLVQPYFADELVLNPGERLDAELAATGMPGGSYEIASSRPDLGIRIPIRYAEEVVPAVGSPFVPPAPRAFTGILEADPLGVLTLRASMRGMMGRGAAWTIDGRAYPDTLPVRVRTNRVVKLRFRNRDGGMMHAIGHPIHIHGTYFQVVSVNGSPPARETWKDTVLVPPGGFVDVAFVMRNPGVWMLHCHIIDHEDNGMMTVVLAEDG